MHNKQRVIGTLRLPKRDVGNFPIHLKKGGAIPPRHYKPPHGALEDLIYANKEEQSRLGHGHMTEHGIPSFMVATGGSANASNKGSGTSTSWGGKDTNNKSGISGGSSAGVGGVGNGSGSKSPSSSNKGTGAGLGGASDHSFSGAQFGHGPSGPSGPGAGPGPGLGGSDRGNESGYGSPSGPSGPSASPGDRSFSGNVFGRTDIGNVNDFSGYSGLDTYSGPKGVTELTHDARYAIAKQANFHPADLSRTPGDAEALARMANAENANVLGPNGLPQLGAIQGVMDVIRNRMISNQYAGETVQDIIGQPKQFSPMFDGRYKKATASPTDIALARGVLSGEVPSIVGNSLNFANRNYINTPKGIQESSLATRNAFNSMEPNKTFVSSADPRNQVTFGTTGKSDVTFNGDDDGTQTAVASVTTPKSGLDAIKQGVGNVTSAVSEIFSPPKAQAEIPIPHRKPTRAVSGIAQPAGTLTSPYSPLAKAAGTLTSPYSPLARAAGTLTGPYSSPVDGPSDLLQRAQQRRDAAIAANQSPDPSGPDDFRTPPRQDLSGVDDFRAPPQSVGALTNLSGPDDFRAPPTRNQSTFPGRPGYPAFNGFRNLAPRSTLLDKVDRETGNVTTLGKTSPLGVHQVSDLTGVDDFRSAPGIQAPRSLSDLRGVDDFRASPSSVSSLSNLSGPDDFRAPPRAPVNRQRALNADKYGDPEGIRSFSGVTNGVPIRSPALQRPSDVATLASMRPPGQMPDLPAYQPRSAEDLTRQAAQVAALKSHLAGLSPDQAQSLAKSPVLGNINKAAEKVKQFSEHSIVGPSIVAHEAQKALAKAEQAVASWQKGMLSKAAAAAAVQKAQQAAEAVKVSQASPPAQAVPPAKPKRTLLGRVVGGVADLGTGALFGPAYPALKSAGVPTFGGLLAADIDHWATLTPAQKEEAMVRAHAREAERQADRNLGGVGRPDNAPPGSGGGVVPPASGVDEGDGDIGITPVPTREFLGYPDDPYNYGRRGGHRYFT